MKSEQIKGFAFKAFDLPIIVEVKGKDWMYFGENNLFPSKLIEIYNNSSMHRTCIQAISAAIQGNGIIEYGDTIVNQRGETLNELFDKIVSDYTIHGGYAVNTIWNKGADAVVELYHVPFERVRSGKCDEYGDVQTYYYSTDWTNTRKYVPLEYRAFDRTDNKKENASQIFYYKDYTPGNEYYPLPDYAGALNDCELDIRISRFHNSNISTGLSPSLAINFRNGQPTEEERLEIYNDIKNTFSGEDNAGRFWLTFSEPGQEPQFNPIQSANDTYYTTLEERISSRVLTAHHITSPLLLGIKDSNGFSSNAAEIETAWAHFLGTVIVPKQKILLKSIKPFMRAFGLNVTLEIEQAKVLYIDAIQSQNTQQ